jgi:NAD-dependent DNA ligase
VAVRGEIIIAKEVFDKKYKKEFANPRNFVAGIVNKKTVDLKVVKDLEFIAYELIYPVMKPLEQMLQFSQLDFDHVKYDTKEKISNRELSEILIDWRKDYKYEIDGIIVVNDEIYPRPKKNPDYAFAFKMVISDQVAEAKVVDVLWTPSKDGYLKPRVQIEPINLGGVTVEYATGFNAKFIEDNKIGVGSVITIIRSGDVIPHIISVVTPAEYIKFPSVPYKWNDTHVDIILDNKEEDDTVREKNITAFFKNLEVEGIGPGNVKRLVEAGFDTVVKILAMKEADFLKVDGFKKKTADKLYNGIMKKIEKATLAEIMTASNIFGRGFGDKSFNKILEKYPNILISEESDKEKKSKLVKVEGIAVKTANKFVEHIPEFIKFLKNANLMYKLENSEVITSKIDETHLLFKKKIVMTGFRDKELIEKLKSVGAENSAAVSKNTFVVIVKEDEDTGKTEQAKKLNIPVMTLKEFNKKYFN